MRRIGLYAALILFVGALGLSWLTHGTGVIKNDTSQNIYIPKDLTMPLQVMVAYNGRDIFFRYRWPARQPSIYHDMMKFEGGKWVRYGDSVAGPQPQGIYEDRVTMLVDDGSVPEFARYGGYITVGDRMRFFTNEAKAGGGQSASLSRPKAQSDRGRQVSAGDPKGYQRLGLGRARGGARGPAQGWLLPRPVALAGASRKPDRRLRRPVRVRCSRRATPARAPSPTTGTPEAAAEIHVRPAKKPSQRALKWDDLIQRKLGFDDVYFISEDTAVPFDAAFAWKEGDTIPRRLLRTPDGSHADITVSGKARWKDGYWDVTLKRAMDTGKPADDKIMLDKRSTISPSRCIATRSAAAGTTCLCRSRWDSAAMPIWSRRVLMATSRNGIRRGTPSRYSIPAR